MSRTYRKNKKDDIDAQKMSGKRWSFFVGNDEFIREVNSGDDIDKDKYLVRTLVCKGGRRRKFIHEKEAVIFNPYVGFYNEIYTSSVFNLFKDETGLSTPKSFRKSLESSYKMKSKKEILKWKNDSNHEIIIHPVKMVANAKWLYF